MYHLQRFVKFKNIFHGSFCTGLLICFFFIHLKYFLSLKKFHLKFCFLIVERNYLDKLEKKSNIFEALYVLIVYFCSQTNTALKR